MDNFVERRFRKEQQLQNSSSLWESARTAIDNCCNSFREKYSGFAQLTNETKNGSRVLVSVTFLHAPGYTRNISVEYSRSTGVIIVTVEGGPANKFHIDADVDHVFLTHLAQEISIDKFTEQALEKPLFESPKAPASGPAWRGPHT